MDEPHSPRNRSSTFGVIAMPKAARKPIADKLRGALKTAGEAQGWWNSSGLLVALSGGGDSMAAFELLRRFFPGKIAAAHLEHGVRGESSMADAEFVVRHCEKNGVRCFVRHGDVNKNRLRGESVEMAGRRLRYDFFFELLDSEGFDFVAVGHNSDDAVETMLLNLFRGTGLSGLSGISPQRDRVVRPVISVSRKDLRQFLVESGITWREDETNDGSLYQRNKIRNQLLPWVRANLNESAETVLLGLSEECFRADAETEEDARGLLAWLSRPIPLALACWDTATTGKLSQDRLASAIRAQGRLLSLPVLSRRKLENLCGLITGAGRWRFQWARDVEVCGAKGGIAWIKRADLEPPETVVARLEDGESRTIDWGQWRISFKLDSTNRIPPRGGNWSARLPAGSPCILSVASAKNQRENYGILREIPWWSAAGMPILLWECGNRKLGWMPGFLKSDYTEGDGVIIVRVFCRDEFGHDGSAGPWKG
jgi:tRNA(Ile)-lysidine synthase